MTKQNMIDAIYETIADKELSLGCVLKFREKELSDKLGNIFLYKYVREGSSSSEGYDGKKLEPGQLSFSNMREGQFKFFTINSRENMYWRPDEEGERISDKFVDKYFQIIGHPILIGDVLDYYSKLPHAEIYTDNTWVILNVWKDKTKPIEEQSDECIKYVYDLIQTIK